MGVQASELGRLGLREQVRDLVPRTGARGGDAELGMRPKLSYRNWDTFHVGLVFFMSFPHKPWAMGGSTSGTWQDLAGLGVGTGGVGEALGHHGCT